MIDMDWQAVRVPGSSELWYSHGGITKAAANVMKELKSLEILKQAFDYDSERGTDKFKILVVGHSLGAGNSVNFFKLNKNKN